MKSILPEPEFDDNTYFYEILPSHKALEAQWISENMNPNKKLGIVSTGHDGIELAKLDSDVFVFVSHETPTPILDKTKEYTQNVYRMGKNYPECYRNAEINMGNRTDMINVSAGKVAKHVANREIVEDALRNIEPDYIFIPSSNMNLTLGILEGLKEEEINGVTVVACVLPDHLNLSPRFNTNYKHKPFFTGITSMGHDAPSLHRGYKLHNNVIIKTVQSPDYCFAKYKDYYPTLGAMNYLSMEISRKFNNEDDEKLILITGENLL